MPANGNTFSTVSSSLASVCSSFLGPYGHEFKHASLLTVHSQGRCVQVVCLTCWRKPHLFFNGFIKNHSLLTGPLRPGICHTCWRKPPLFFLRLISLRSHLQAHISQPWLALGSSPRFVAESPPSLNGFMLGLPRMLSPLCPNMNSFKPPKWKLRLLDVCLTIIFALSSKMEVALAGCLLDNYFPCALWPCSLG